MNKFRTRGEKIFSVCNTIFLILFSFIVLYPIWHVLMYSLSDATKIGSTQTFLYPKGFSLKAYEILMRDSSFWNSYLNTIFVVLVIAIVNVFTCFMLAYPLAQDHFGGRKTLSYMVLIITKFSGGLVPIYLLMRSLGLLNSLWALILPFCNGVGNVFIIRKFIQAIPGSLRESALMDGAGEMKIMLRIIMPLCIPSIAVLTLMNIVNHWNRWFECMIYINDRSKYTIMPMLREMLFVYGSADFFKNDPDLQVSGTSNMTEIVKMATVIASVLPVMMIYPFIQKYFVQGTMVGSVKG